MLRERIIRSLTQACRREWKQFEAARDEALRLPAEIARSVFVMRLGQEVEELLRSEHPAFAEGHALMIHEIGGARGFLPQSAASGMIEQVLGGASAESTWQWLEELLGTTHATGIAVMALYGVAVEAEIELDGGFRIIPLD